MATLSFSNIGTTSLTARVSGLDPSVPYVVRVLWYVNGSFYDSTYTTSSSTSISITGLNSDTTYAIVAEIYNDDDRILLDILSRSVTTDEDIPKVPTPSLDTSKTIKTSNSISVTTNMFSQADYYYFRINGGTTIDNGLNRTYTFTGLTPNTQYRIEIKIGANGYIDSDWVGYTATTLATELWEWTIAERNAFNNNGDIEVFTYQRWNQFVDKIYETSSNTWLNSEVQGAILSHSATKMTSSDKKITATRFNSARYNIGARISTGINKVYKDDIVYGSYFITLGNKLNEWIASL